MQNSQKEAFRSNLRSQLSQMNPEGQGKMDSVNYEELDQIMQDNIVRSQQNQQLKTPKNSQ